MDDLDLFENQIPRSSRITENDIDRHEDNILKSLWLAPENVKIENLTYGMTTLNPAWSRSGFLLIEMRLVTCTTFEMWFRTEEILYSNMIFRSVDTIDEVMEKFISDMTTREVKKDILRIFA